MLNELGRKLLDKRLSWPFKKWNIIADVKGELIWVFDSISYHWWTPDADIYWKYIFASFSKAISRQWRSDWEAINCPCGDDDVYIDRRKNNLTENYRFATETEIELLNTLMEKEMINEANNKIRDKEKRKLRMKKKEKG